MRYPSKINRSRINPIIIRMDEEVERMGFSVLKKPIFPVEMRDGRYFMSICVRYKDMPTINVLMQFEWTDQSMKMRFF